MTPNQQISKSANRPMVRWAILGPGKIAKKFADAFRSVPSAQLYAIASRDAGRGREFAKEFGIPKVHASYEALVNDPEVDIVYIATPHPFHHEQTMLCLSHQKAVLCEKPLTMSYRQALEMVTLARSKNTFLMEGMWTRFFPATIKALELIRSGVIGEVRFLKADFGFAAPFIPEGRVYNLKLGGGAQLDVGVYPMFLVLLIMGKPKQVHAVATKASTGADETTAVQFHFEGGGMAHILSSVGLDTPREAEIVGTLGSITLHAQWHKAQSLTVKKKSGEIEKIETPYKGIGFEFQLAHVTECIQQNLKESKLMSLDFSLLMAETADEILRQCDIIYPNNKS